jgi:hypothetical protein
MIVSNEVCSTFTAMSLRTLLSDHLCCTTVNPLYDSGIITLGPTHTRNLNQDPLENTFGAIRSNCDLNNNPMWDSL